MPKLAEEYMEEVLVVATSIGIKELEEKLALMQKELEVMKENEANKQPSVSAVVHEKYKERWRKNQDEVMDMLKDMINEGVGAASVVITITKFVPDSINSGIGLVTMDSLEDISEDKISTALDVFTNPRRIALLKLLIIKTLTASEIARETGLAGGQLYHHLSILENAKLIERNGDKYSTNGRAQTLLCGLNSALGGMDMTR